MDYDERVMALKKAYADMILNTSKEAAARVMMSERKAQRFENELKVAKEQGLRMMLRIKQMMDAKVSEAESTALNQKRKIDELEAQLHEAEDIMRDLREELREVQSELETQVHVADFRKPELYSGPIYSHTVGHFGPSIYRGYSNGGSLDLPSIISRRKEPLFYKNGCTHRIRASEDRLVQGSTSSIELEPKESEPDNHLPKHTITDRHFKYTFQRKRKRESLLNENESPENYLPKENVPVENNCSLSFF